MILKRSKWSRVQKLIIYARINILRNITRKLNSEQLESFRKLIFGSFLHLKISKFHIQLLYYIIRRQCTLTKEDELWFSFEGTLAKFGIREFKAIIGLNCGPLPK